ncbi:ubiquinone biosynthesis accessory factor UbiJ [Kangiella marina]|uniref:Ubiquinone biosynthesis accessory factor UbiJ n=1 Tax=Kangiella marina TaxID=1079178 RepID=A0ABP8IHJ7_9GAMM
MLVELFAPTIETVINTVISLDPEGKQRLHPLNQKIIAFHFTDIGQQLYFSIDESYIVVKSDLEVEPDAELTGSLLSFFNLASGDDSDPIFKGDVRFSGEISTAQNFQKFFNQLDIDWEEHLSHYIGDIAAHQLFNHGRAMFDWVKSSTQTAKNNASEYLRFEAKAVPASIELENFYDDIADLKSGVERLGMRIERLRQQSQQEQPQQEPSH